MASNVEIANRALQLLGCSAIVALDEDSRDARAMNLAYLPRLMHELRVRVWNFAKKNVQLAASPVPPAWGRANTFQLPSDYLRLLPTYPEYINGQTDWQIQGKVIYTNQTAPLNFIYIAMTEDPNLMDPAFREMLSASLAISTCKQLTQSTSLLGEIKEFYKEQLAGARLANALENIPTEAAEDSYLTIRR